MDQLNTLLAQYPEALQPTLRRWAQAFAEALQRESLAWPDDVAPDFIEALLAIWARSDFVGESWQLSPALMLELWRSGDLQRAYDDETLRQSLRQRLASVADEAALLRELRLFRRREMVRIVWRDLMRWCPMEVTTRDMSLLAEACIDGALDWLYQSACAQWGVPYGWESQVPQRLVVLGMGKLGAYELNVSSDIDLIFSFPEQGETRGGTRPIENQLFFVRLAQRLILALDKITADGFVFRVDMRLRPYGESGALALSFNAMEEYYQDQGRDWERYAMIKARVVAGDRASGERLMRDLRPFVYRRYIDFSAIEALRGMKEMIAREVRRRGLENDIKLGPGGIREIEFIVQAFQLIRGGRNAQLQERNLQKVLTVLAEEELLPREAVDELRQAYVFLRNLEHAVQGLEDKQTQLLPVDEVAQQRVALAMGFACWADLAAVLAAHRERVRGHFVDVIAPAEQPEATVSADELEGWTEFWQGDLTEEEETLWLRATGYEVPEEAAALVRKLRESKRIRMLQSQGRERLDQFMPVLLKRVATHNGDVQTLQRLLGLVESVARRTAYLVLLLENPGAFYELIRLCAESPWIAEQLTQTPLLLDELLHTESLYRPLSLQDLKDELRQQMLRVPQDDLEQQMDALRHFKKANVLRVAASEMRGTLPIMKVSDSLTWLAETILERVLDLAWEAMVAKHGRPQRVSGEPCDPDFVIIGYGKLGGLELGHSSDLDLVFIHGAADNLPTDGERPVDGAIFFARLGQRIVHLLTTHTTSGQLYEADLRLRPSGNSGLLVSSLKAFEQYQMQDAWTWEHQALVRARMVAGSPRVGAAFEAIRRQILGRERDRGLLQKEVREMRERMRESLASSPAAARFCLKQDAGGIVDIEFMVQYGVLGWAHEHERLMIWPDNIRILEEFGVAGVMAPAIAEDLTQIYKAYRSRLHILTLQNLPADVAADEFVEERRRVLDYWTRFMEQAPSVLLE